jgi:hypothetical protein
VKLWHGVAMAPLQRWPATIVTSENDGNGERRRTASEQLVNH